MDPLSHEQKNTVHPPQKCFLALFRLIGEGVFGGLFQLDWSHKMQSVFQVITIEGPNLSTVSLGNSWSACYLIWLSLKMQQSKNHTSGFHQLKDEFCVQEPYCASCEAGWLHVTMCINKYTLQVPRFWVQQQCLISLCQRRNLKVIRYPATFKQTLRCLMDEIFMISLLMKMTWTTNRGWTIILFTFSAILPCHEVSKIQFNV